VFNAGKYLDRMVATPDGLRLKRKVVVFDTYRIPNLLVTPL
jgi:3-phenylpropionate/cinnamic acid dioxygenase small subunit